MKWYGIYTRIDYPDGTHCDLTEHEPAALFRDKRTAEEIAVLMSIPLRGGVTTKIVKEIQGKFQTDLSDQERQAADGQEVKSER